METFIQAYELQDKTLCDELIKYYEKNTEYKHSGANINNNNIGKKSTDVNVFNTSSNKYIKKYFEELNVFVNLYVQKYFMNAELISATEGFNIQHYKKGEAFYAWHSEREVAHYKNVFIGMRTLVFMTYLNTLKEDGGETEFYFQKIKFKPKKGVTLIWPAEFTHRHRGIPSLKEEKIITTGWFCLSK